MTADPAHISVTAKVSAYYRKFSDIAFAAEVAMLEERWLEDIRVLELPYQRLRNAKPMLRLKK